MDFTDPTGGRPDYAPLRYEAVNDLASQICALLRPSRESEHPTALETVTWWLGIALGQVADLINPDTDPAELAGTVEELAAELRIALHHAHTHWAGIQTTAELADWRSANDANRNDEEAVTSAATLILRLPNEEEITVELDESAYHEPGFTTVSTDSPQLSTSIDGTDHLEIASALTIISTVLTRHLTEDALRTR